ncbi:hypothetical protein QL285_066238 [Trifolium repens]|nr:hypothetical protein QL285_066238 [Trifolium repens]
MVILLKSLEDHLFKASISEDMLEILEVLEKHLLDGSNSITTTMKSAYCRVAVECTLKYFEAKASHPTYLQAVDRIWRVCFPPRYFRMEALHKVQMFFDEAWDNFCPSFLHPAAQIVTDSQQRRRASSIKDMYAALVDDGSTDTTTSCSKIASMPIDESLQCSSMELENQELVDMNQDSGGTI